MPEIAFSAAQAYRRLYQIEPKPEYVRRSIELYQRYLARREDRWPRRRCRRQPRRDEARARQARGRRRLDDRVEIDRGPHAARRQRQRARSSDDRARDAARDRGAARVSTVKGLTASIDGKKVEPFALVDVDAKEHVISVAADGYFPVEKKTLAVAGQSTVRRCRAPARSRRSVVDQDRRRRPHHSSTAGPSRPRRAPRSRSRAGKHLSTVLHNGREPFGKELAVVRGQQLTLTRPAREDVAPPRGALGPRRRGRPRGRRGEHGARRAVARQQRQRPARSDRDGQSAARRRGRVRPSRKLARPVRDVDLASRRCCGRDRCSRRLSVLLRYPDSRFGYDRSEWTILNP